MAYEQRIHDYAEVLETEGKGLSGQMYGLALDGAIGRLCRTYPDIPVDTIVDDLINKRRELHELTKQKEWENRNV